jgi:hypothetical protein
MADFSLSASLLLVTTALTPAVTDAPLPRTIYHTATLDISPHYPEVISLSELTGGECLTRAAVLTSLIHTDPGLALYSGKPPIMGACLNREAYLAAKLKLGQAGAGQDTSLRPSQFMQAIVTRYNKAGVGDVGFAYTCNPKDYPADAAKLAATAQRMLRTREEVILPVDRAAAARVCKVTAGKPVAPTGFVSGLAPDPVPVPLPNLEQRQFVPRPPSML